MLGWITPWAPRVLPLPRGKASARPDPLPPPKQLATVWPVREKALDWLRTQQILTPNQEARLQYSSLMQAAAGAALVSRSMEDRIRRALRDSVEDGEGRDAWFNRVSEIVDITRHEAEAIQRTFNHRAAHEGLAEVMSTPAVRDEFPYFLWEGADDGRQRESHRDLNGKVAHRDSPLAKSMQEHIRDWNCILPGTKVEGDFLAAVRSFYSGQAVEIVTESGAKLRVTEKHPILTEHGLVNAGSLQQGNKLLRHVGHREVAGSDAAELSLCPRAPQVDHQPIEIEKVFRAIAAVGAVERARCVVSDFHGDGEFIQGDIDVVWTDRQLLRNRESGGLNHLGDVVFKSPLDGLMGAENLQASLVAIHPRPLQSFRVGMTTDLDVFLSKSSKKNRPAYSSVVGQLLERDPGLIPLNKGVDVDIQPAAPSGHAKTFEPLADSLSLATEACANLMHGKPALIGFDKIVSIDTFAYSGHVYDLQSVTGVIVAESILLANCRCTMIPLSRDDAVARGIDDDTGWVEPERESPPETDDEPILLFDDPPAPTPAPAKPAAPPPLVIGTKNPPADRTKPAAPVATPFDAAFDQLNARFKDRNLVPIAELRAALPSMSAAEFDAYIKDLQKNQHYRLTTAHDALTTPAEYRAGGVKIGSTKFVYATRHENYSPVAATELPADDALVTIHEGVLGFDGQPGAEKIPKKPAKEKYRVVQKLGGSTGAEKVVDAKGNQFVRKFGASPEHVREEFAAEEMYRAAGVPVPASRLEKQDGKPVKLSEFITARPLGVLAGEDRKKAEAAVRKHFAVDALFGNWDVIGMEADNVLVTPDGTVHRVDVGGSLRFRAQGGEKPFSEFPDELTTLRNPARSAARVFKPLTNRELAEQIDDLQSRREAILAAAPKDIRPTLEKRLDNMRSIAELWRKESGTKRERNWDEIQKMMRSTKVRSRFPDVTPIQKESLEKYTDNAFMPLNAALRANPTNPDFQPTGNLVNPVEVHNTLQEMFARVGELPKEMVLYRGRKSLATVDKMEEVMNAGGTVTMDGYNSASFDPSVAAEKFGPVVYEIVARSGLDLASMHGHKGIKLAYGTTESELMQNHGTKYKVVGIQRRVPGKLFGDLIHDVVHVIQMVEVR